MLGSAASVFTEDVSELPPAPDASRKRSVPVPVGPRSAIQYAVPAVTDAADVRMTSFHAAAAGADSDPLASNAPGWPALSA